MKIWSALLYQLIASNWFLIGFKVLLDYEEAFWSKNWRYVRPVKFGQTSIRFWFFLSYLITTVRSRLIIGFQSFLKDQSYLLVKYYGHSAHKKVTSNFKKWSFLRRAQFFLQNQQIIEFLKKLHKANKFSFWFVTCYRVFF